MATCIQWLLWKCAPPFSWFSEHNWPTCPAAAPLDPPPPFGTMTTLPPGYSQPTPVHGMGAEACPCQRDTGPPLSYLSSDTPHRHGWTFLGTLLHSKMHPTQPPNLPPLLPRARPTSCSAGVPCLPLLPSPRSLLHAWPHVTVWLLSRPDLVIGKC